jgi:uncharacterized protein YacL
MFILEIFGWWLIGVISSLVISYLFLTDLKFSITPLKLITYSATGIFGPVLLVIVIIICTMTFFSYIIDRYSEWLNKPLF